MQLFVNSIMMLFITFAIVINAEAEENLNKTDTVKIYGNCGMCKKTIEKAANSDGVAKVDWNKETKMATISYDSKKTNPDEILKRIAYAGYDSDKFTAPDKAYNNLHGCCQYDRPKKN
jgi:copper chaperone CopZ